MEINKIKEITIYIMLIITNVLSFNINELSQTKQWQRLLHVKNGESEIDDPTFFFAKNGKTDPKAELQATIKQLILDKSDDENSTQCYYPSRSAWILKNIPELKEQVFQPACDALHKELKTLDAKYITVILASAHINSPASAFGHTFLRIDNNPKTPLLSYSVNYAAMTSEDNGLIYAYQGIFGGYQGRYSVAHYYEKLKSYSDLEQRDIWEYRLNLSKEEIEKMVRHIFEVRHFYADYFFLAENCSYNLLWLIEVAKDEVELTSQFNHKAIPIDTVRAIIDANLVAQTTYRPSKRKKILALSEPIKNNPTALSFAKSKEHNLSLIAALTKKEKIASLELATALLQIDYAENEIEKKEYLPKFLRLLKARSKLGKIKREKIAEPTSPSLSHKTAKATISASSQEHIKANIKVAYHDIYDNDSGFVPGSYINFINTSLVYEDKKVKLDRLDLLDIKSYALQDAIFKPISWQVSLGGKRIFNNELNVYLQAGGGFTFGNEEFYGYTTLTPTIYYKEHDDYSISANAGVLYNPSASFKLGLMASKEWFDKEREIKRIEPFITYSLDQENAINLKYEYEEMNELREEEFMVSWFWYF
jgi:hypothetical protein